MIKARRIDMRLWFAVGMVVIIGMLCLFPVKAYAAGEGTLKASKDCISIGVGETAVVSIECTDIAGGFSDLAVVSANPEVAVGVLAQESGNTVSLGIASVGAGTTSFAVYRVSNPAVVTYVAVLSGMAEKGQIVTQVTGNQLTTTYEDCIIHYGATLTGKNDAQFTVNGLVLERESGIDCLKVTGTLTAKDNKVPGLNTFYASFYDPAGALIKRQAVYSRDPEVDTTLTLKWYVPYGSAQIVIE